jgi:hypothetical protein
MQTIFFQNPGEIDPRVITTMGVNVKPGAAASGPIGYFGTGLKYAIAVLLRNEQEVEVWSGLTKYSFSLAPQDIRGKWFNLVAMAKDGGSPRSLGFTSDLGKNWTVENAYRELHSNSLDECGEPGQEGEPAPRAGRTCIVVRGGAFAKAHRERFSFLLDPSRVKLFNDGTVEVFAGQSSKVFYKGIAAMQLPEDCPSSYTYNLLGKQRLTEDRTFESCWSIQEQISRCLCTAAPEGVLETVFTSKSVMEANLSYGFAKPSEQALDTIEKIMKERPLALLDNVRSVYFRNRSKEVKREEAQLSSEQKAALADAMRFCESIGFHISQYPVKYCQSLGERVIALADQGTIWLSRRAFDESLLVESLLEEFIHLRNRVADETRQMQNVLFAEIIRLGRQTRGLPPLGRQPPRILLNDEIPF